MTEHYLLIRFLSLPYFATFTRPLVSIAGSVISKGRLRARARCSVSRVILNVKLAPHFASRLGNELR
jgi:hypothetical protein